MALAFQGRFDEAIAEGKRAIELDPLSPQVLIDAAVPFMFQRNSAAAKELARKAAELDPMYFFPVMIDGWTDLEVGKFRDAIPALKKAKAMESPPFVTAYLAFAYGAAGDRAGRDGRSSRSSRRSHGMARYCRSTWRLCTSVLATAPARSTTSSGPSRPIRR